MLAKKGKMNSQFLNRDLANNLNRHIKKLLQLILTGDQFPTFHSPHGLKQLEISAGRGK